MREQLIYLRAGYARTEWENYSRRRVGYARVYISTLRSGGLPAFHAARRGVSNLTSFFIDESRSSKRRTISARSRDLTTPRNQHAGEFPSRLLPLTLAYIYFSVYNASFPPRNTYDCERVFKKLLSPILLDVARENSLRARERKFHFRELYNTRNIIACASELKFLHRR